MELGNNQSGVKRDFGKLGAGAWPDLWEEWRILCNVVSITEVCEANSRSATNLVKYDTGEARPGARPGPWEEANGREVL